MNLEKKKNNFLKKSLYTICFLCLIAAFVFLGTREYTVKEISDNELFAKEYRTVGNDNNFQVLTSYETLNLLERETGLLFLGYSSNEWSATIAELLDQVSKETNYSISYYNFLADRDKKHDNYQGIVRELDGYLLRDDMNRVEIHAPTIVAVIRGEVIFYDDETSFVNHKETPKSYWTSEKRFEKLASYREVIEILKKEMA